MKSPKASRSFAPKTSGMGGPKSAISKVRSISAPAKPKMATSTSAHGKLRKGDC